MPIGKLTTVYDTDKAAIIERLRTFLNTRSEILFTLLYGSLVDPVVPERYGDIDLALYVNFDSNEKPEYIIESQIEGEAKRLLADGGLDYLPVEATIINNAPFSFLIKLFKGRYLVLKENEEALTDLIEEAGHKSMINHHLLSESLREAVGD